MAGSSPAKSTERSGVKGTTIAHPPAVIPTKVGTHGSVRTTHADSARPSPIGPTGPCHRPLRALDPDLRRDDAGEGERRGANRHLYPPRSASPAKALPPNSRHP